MPSLLTGNQFNGYERGTPGLERGRVIEKIV